MYLKVISPEDLLLDVETNMVQFPGWEGSFTVLDGHAPLISSLRQGQIRYWKENGDEESLAVESGFVEVADDEVKVCVD